MEIYSLFVRNLDGKTLSLTFPQNFIDGETISNKICAATKIPIPLQLLVAEGRHVYSKTILHASSSSIFPTVHLLLRLAGGKGGFGSLLRGAGSKAGKKKTNNYDACRDLNGRRLRHVNAEKKLEEWQAEAEERRLEKIANDFIKKNTKSGQKAREGEAEKYVAKYREESAKCVEVVEASVRETFQIFKNSKRKLRSVPESDSRRLKLWNGKNKLDESDSGEESEDEDEPQDDESSDKSIILDNNVSDSSQEHDMCTKSFNHISDGPSPKTLPVEELHIAQKNSRSEEAAPENEYSTRNTEELVDEHVGSSSVDTAESKEETSSDGGRLEGKPLNFDEFHSPTELEGIGMEMLKIELQARGLKCGGTLQERAARLFLLKTTPLELLPKKVLAKK